MWSQKNDAFLLFPKVIKIFAQKTNFDWFIDPLSMVKASGQNST